MNEEQRAIVAAAVAWYREHEQGEEIFSDELDPLRDAVRAHLRQQAPPREPVPLTWGQVPAGWEVLAPDGKWYRVEATRCDGMPGTVGVQTVTMLGKTWKRDPAAPVTARPGEANATDAAIAALGYPQVLEDGPHE